MAWIAGAVMAAVGTGMLIAGGVKKKKARALQPSPEHAEARLELARLRRQSKAYETGMAYKSTEDTLQNVLRAQNINAGRLSGGASGAALGASARNAQAISNVIGEVGTKSRQVGIAQGAAAGTRMDTILQRKDELQLLKQSQLYAEAAQLNKAGWQNVTAGVGGIAGGIAGGGGTTGEGLGDLANVSTPTDDGSGSNTAKSVANATGGSQDASSSGSKLNMDAIKGALSNPEVIAALAGALGGK